MSSVGLPGKPQPQPALRKKNREALRDLITTPLTFLREHVVLSSCGTGDQTVYDSAARFALHKSNGSLLISQSVAPTQYPDLIHVATLSTLTRQSGAGDTAERFNAVQRFGTSCGAKLWLTDRQTGCTVLALDWGQGEFSMFHLKPHENEHFRRLKGTLVKLGGRARAIVKNPVLRKDAKSVVAASTNGGEAPERYIMLQSMHNSATHREMQTIGIRDGHSWDFYRQLITPNASGGLVHAVELAAWKPWSGALKDL